MIFAAILSCVLCPPLSAGFAEFSVPKLEKLVVVSAEQKTIEDIEKKYKFGMSSDDLQSSLKSKEVVLQPWGQSGAIVLDLSSGPLGEAASAEKALKAMAQGLGQDLTLQLGNLSSDDRNALEGVLDRFVPAELRDPKANVGDVRLGLDVCLQLSITSGGRTINISHSLVSDDQYGSRAASMTKGVLRKRPPGEVDQARLEDHMKGLRNARDQVIFRLAGQAKYSPASAIEAGQKALEKELSAIQASTNDLAGNLLQKLGIDSRNGQSGGLDAMPKELRDKVVDSFGRSFQANGFSSREEAESFILNSAGISFERQLSLAVCERAPDAASRRPGVYAAYVFIRTGGS